MASRYELIHHPAAAADYSAACDYFTEIDPGLAKIFQTDFRTALQGIASGRLSSKLYASGHTIRWVKLRRFLHKVFFESAGDDKRFILAVISGKRHPTRIRLMLSRRRKSS